MGVTSDSDKKLALSPNVVVTPLGEGALTAAERAVATIVANSPTIAR